MALTSSAVKLNKQVLPYVEAVAEVNGGMLLSRGAVCDMAAEFLKVTRQAVSTRLVDGVADGRLIEIRPRADWLIRLPEGDDLPDLYAHLASNTALYTLERTPPSSRGAGNVSFIATPESLRILLKDLRERLGLPEPDGFEVYRPVLPRRLSHEDYARLQEVLCENSTNDRHKVPAGGTIDEVLAILKLLPPQRVE